LDYDFDLYQRRCSELGIDPEYRVGKLTYVCRIHSNRHGGVCGALMLCDCGRYCKIGLPTIYGTGGRELPFDCPTCVSIRAKAAKVVATKRAKKIRKAMAEKRRLVANSAATIRAKHVKEYYTWNNTFKLRKEPVTKKWLGKKGFLQFLADLGSQPYPRSGLARRDPTRVHCKENTYWYIPQKYQKLNPQ